MKPKLTIMHVVTLGIGVLGGVLAYLSQHGVTLPDWVPTLMLAGNGVLALFVTAPNDVAVVKAADVTQPVPR